MTMKWDQVTIDEAVQMLKKLRAELEFKGTPEEMKRRDERIARGFLKVMQLREQDVPAEGDSD